MFKFFFDPVIDKGSPENGGLQKCSIMDPGQWSAVGFEHNLDQWSQTQIAFVPYYIVSKKKFSGQISSVIFNLIH